MTVELPLPIRVEIRPGGAWVDITADVRTSEIIEIVSGKRDEGEQVDPTTIKGIKLNNRHGKYSPRNPLSPYYGQLTPDTPIRVLVDWPSTSVRGIGYVSEWPTRWDMSGNDSWVPVQAAGETRRMQDRDRVLDSAIRRFVPRSTEFVVAYWPMEDEGGGSFAPGLAHKPMSIDGPVDFATVDKHGSKPLPMIQGGASILGPIPGFVPVDDSYRVDWFFRMDDPPATDRHMLDLHTSSPQAARFIPRISSTQFSVRVIDADGANSSLISEAIHPSLVGSQLQCLLRVAMFGSSLSYNIRVWKIDHADPSLRTLLHSRDEFAAGGSGHTLGRPTKMFMPGFTQPRSLGHVIVSRSGNFIDADPLQFLAFNGFPSETAGNRIVRLCLEESVPVTFYGFDLEDTEPVGPQPLGKFLDVARDAAEVDGGDLGEFGNSLPGLAYRTRRSKYRQATALTLTEGQLSGAPEPTDDDQQLVDQVKARRRNGGQAVVGSLEPRRGIELELNAVNDGRLRHLAAWRLSLGQVDEMRWPRLPFSLVAHPELAPDWLALRVGDRVRYLHQKSQLPGVEVDLLVEGWTEQLSMHRWDIELVCAPASPFSPAVFDEARFDTEASELAAEFEAGTDTSLSVATTEGPLWTTDSGELPLDVFTSGVVLRVTAISGSSSPQTFTVQQAPVNGVSKTVPAGSKVNLHPRPRFGL